MSYDYLIVGQGLAGSILAYRLLKLGKTVLVIDHALTTSASKVASGLVNPVTGRRLVKSWRIDEFLPYSLAFYQELEREWQIDLVKQAGIIRIFESTQEHNDFIIKSSEKRLSAYLLASEVSTPLAPYHSSYSSGKITHSFRVDVARFIHQMSAVLAQQQALIQTQLDYNDVHIEQDQVTWQDHSAQRIIFCEGHRASENPWFGHLPYTKAKGEVLIIHCPDLNEKQFIKKGIFLIPLGQDQYWVGSNYLWNDDTEVPTVAGIAGLKHKLDRLLNMPYTIVSEKAAIRPSIKDRRPLLGAHPHFPHCYIFNGLGTKGVSLAPYFSTHLLQFIHQRAPLHPEVDIRRFG